MSLSLRILNRHIRLFNDGVQTGSFDPMVRHFSEDAEMYFEGIPVGPFKGRKAIELAYSQQPPDDEIVILKVREGQSSNVVIAEYAWLKNPKIRAGEMRVTTTGDLIAKVTVQYER